MRAIEITAFGPPEVLQETLRPHPVPGLEVAGTLAAGDAVDLDRASLALGDRVCALVAGGGYAELCTAPLGQCLPVPPGLSFVEAASLPETFFTVWSNVFDRAALQPGETLLVHGGSSAIGVAAIQLGKAFGATVLAGGRVRPVIAAVFPAAQAARAHALMEANEHTGKIVLDWT